MSTTDLPVNEKFEYSNKEHDDKYAVRAAEIDPLDDREPDDGIPYQFTWRAVIIGSLLGCVVAASNMYIGLKSGWTFGASIFGAILGFTLIKPMEKLPERWGGGPFGIKENCTVQTAATAAGGLSAGYLTAIPALFRLGIYTDIDGIWDMMFLWTFAAAFYGLFFAIPLRKYFRSTIGNLILLLSPFFTCLLFFFSLVHSWLSAGYLTAIPALFRLGILKDIDGSFLYKIIGYFVPFIIDLHPLYWIGEAAKSQAMMDISTTWRWHIQVTTAFIGAGMMMGTNTVLSLMAGNIFAWAIMSPTLFYYTEGIVSHKSPWGFKIANGVISSQLWLLWPGIVIMICASFTELACQYKSVYNGFRGGFLSLYNFFARLMGRNQVQIGDSDGSDYDPVPESEQIPGWQWGLGILVSSICTIIILKFYFAIEWYLGLLAVILGFILSFVATQSSGETDINPTGVIGKTTQFIFAPFKHANPMLDLQVNLIAGNVAASCAAQTVDMVGDLKTGHLLRASPRSQFYAQIIGSIFGVVIAVVVFWVFGKAYPCILTLSEGNDHCPFQAPSVAAWQGVAVALTSNISNSIPPSSQIACLVFGIVTIVTTVLKRTYLKNHANWIPNWNAFGIALVNPAPYILCASFYGLIIAKLWEHYQPNQFKHYNVPLASGLIAGEGIGGVIQAIFEISGMVQEHVATMFACPPDGCA
ncbi:OPT superfamily oligopeptide transporter [Conidiobolus coronatus NRRL 28638]|uniref:OPT superfamily oligopeptide transporter n=1 Tax=Conidiobolus coronatus (strain ATCC 28846 / CBS 209.66 / NRRL 28638) TaxID=796925 RepID=A0A137PF53_CONC2|nr:OPT superfamily oligopeptide transporter [Conidiobolus coronatus NRRL 28638]|eukprot:KXN73602.1 OPT superfamily oligopeptide transporter [Conidiobolus coronatus NRRL 28638]